MKNHSKLRLPSVLLLSVEIVLIATSAYWDTHLTGKFWLSILYAGFFAAAGYVLANSRRWLLSYMILTLAAITLGLVQQSAIVVLLQGFCSVSAFVLLFQEIVRHSFFKPNISQADRIIAGIAGYLLIGLFWSSVFSALVTVDSHALLNQMTNLPPTKAEELYFSFVTLTSVGYGEIVPLTPVAKVASLLAGLSGVLYLAVYISALVGRASVVENNQRS